jgi:hypothetical protein
MDNYSKLIKEYFNLCIHKNIQTDHFLYLIDRLMCYYLHRFIFDFFQSLYFHLTDEQYIITLLQLISDDHIYEYIKKHFLIVHVNNNFETTELILTSCFTVHFSLIDTSKILLIFIDMLYSNEESTEFNEKIYLLISKLILRRRPNYTCFEIKELLVLLFYKKQSSIFRYFWKFGYRILTHEIFVYRTRRWMNEFIPDMHMLTEIINSDYTGYPYTDISTYFILKKYVEIITKGNQRTSFEQAIRTTKLYTSNISDTKNLVDYIFQYV